MTALAPLVSHHDVTWVASALTEEDRVVAAEGLCEETAGDGSRYRLRLVAHPPDAYDLYYNVIANPTLWFVQHRLWDLMHDPGADLTHAWEDGYLAVNRDFADAVVEEIEHEPDAAVFFHDYHLYVAPQLVRERCPDTELAHSPTFPGSAPTTGRCCPPNRACDPPGTARKRRGRVPHRALARRVSLQLRGSRPRLQPLTLVAAHPISVDPAEFEATAPHRVRPRARARTSLRGPST